MDTKNKSDRELLEQAYELSLENNRMLHSQRQAAFIGGIIKFVIWALLFFIIPYYLYAFYLKPYFDQFVGAYQGLEEKRAQIEDIQFPAGFDVQAFFDQFAPQLPQAQETQQAAE